MKTNTNRPVNKPGSDGKIEWFAGARSGLGTTTVSIARDGRLRFNAGFLHAQKLQPYTGVELGYDARGPRILFRFTKAAQDGGTLRLHAHDGGKIANAKAFFTPIASTCGDLSAGTR